MGLISTPVDIYTLRMKSAPASSHLHQSAHLPCTSVIASPAVKTMNGYCAVSSQMNIANLEICTCPCLLTYDVFTGICIPDLFMMNKVLMHLLYMMPKCRPALYDRHAAANCYHHLPLALPYLIHSQSPLESCIYLLLA